MCLLVVNKSRQGLNLEHFENAWSNNGDGFGLAYAHKGGLYTYKNLEDATESYRAYRELRDRFSGPFILHFRFATAGVVDLDNCHPFEIDEGLVFAHNGIIPIKAIPGASDTSAFRDLLQELPKDWLKVPSLRALVTVAAHASKLAFLNAQGEADILNEHLGSWTKGDWFSNDGHLTRLSEWRRLAFLKWERALAEDESTYYVQCTLCDRYNDDIDYTQGDPLCRDCMQLMGITWTRDETINTVPISATSFYGSRR